MKPLPEKYRPKSLDEVVGQEEIVKSLKRMIETGSIHDQYGFIFEGDSGIGKTSVAYALRGELNWEFEEFNGSKVNRIKDIRNTIVKMMSFKPFTGRRRIIFLDEAEMLSYNSQMALRKPIEKYADHNLIILACNEMGKFINALKQETLDGKTVGGRLKVFHFKPIPTDKILERLKYIAQKENIEGNIDGELYKIARNSDGNLRTAIMELSNKAKQPRMEFEI